MALFSHAWSLDYKFFLQFRLLFYAHLGADVMSSRARTKLRPTTASFQAQPVTKSAMSGRVSLKQVFALSPLYEAAEAEARDAEVIPSTKWWINRKSGPACDKIFRVCASEIEKASC